eukprot:535059-Amphidinium_carterae.1
MYQVICNERKQDCHQETKDAHTHTHTLVGGNPSNGHMWLCLLVLCYSKGKTWQRLFERECQAIEQYHPATSQPRFGGYIKLLCEA